MKSYSYRRQLCENTTVTVKDILAKVHPLVKYIVITDSLFSTIYAPIETIRHLPLAIKELFYDSSDIGWFYSWKITQEEFQNVFEIWSIHEVMRGLEEEVFTCAVGPYYYLGVRQEILKKFTSLPRALTENNMLMPYVDNDWFLLRTRNADERKFVWDWLISKLEKSDKNELLIEEYM